MMALADKPMMATRIGTIVASNSAETEVRLKDVTEERLDLLYMMNRIGLTTLLVYGGRGPGYIYKKVAGRAWQTSMHADFQQYQSDILLCVLRCWTLSFNK